MGILIAYLLGILTTIIPKDAKQAEAIRNSYQTRNDKHCPPPEVTVLNNLPSSVKVHQREQDTKDERNYRRFMFLVTTMTLGAIVIYADLVYWQYRQMIRATEEATRSANAAQQQLEATERPWLKVSFIVQPPGITFKDGGMQLNIAARIENIGHSVANGVVSPMKVFLADDANAMFKEPLRRQKELCDELASKPIVHRRGSMEVVIFPNDFDASVGYGLSLSKAEVDAAKDGRIGVKGANLAGPKLLVPIVYGCVDYVFDTSERHHQTQFILELQQTNQISTVPKRIPMIAIRVGQPVDASNVVITKYPFGGFYAY
jgi:hypothetical protein